MRDYYKIMWDGLISALMDIIAIVILMQGNAVTFLCRFNFKGDAAVLEEYPAND